MARARGGESQGSDRFLSSNNATNRTSKQPNSAYAALALALLALLVAQRVHAQGVAQGVPPPATAKTIKCKDRKLPQFEDLTRKAGIQFSHASAPEARYIIESMSGGILLLDYDRDGW